ncbi:MAG: DUF192 domain-containing protein [Nitrospirota bacterium]|nr:DUF192 domain-containing protein [Nitrospirota bacterium]
MNPLHIHIYPASIFMLLMSLGIHLYSPAVAPASDVALKHPTVILRKMTIQRTSRLPDGMPSADVIATFFVESAVDNKSRARGLAGRREISGSNGMLFVLDDRKPVFFWMKGMKFPLDILFFDRNKIVTDIFEDLSPCDDCPLISPSGPATYALEINAGLTKKYGITSGDRFVIGEAYLPQPEGLPETELYTGGNM